MQQTMPYTVSDIELRVPSACLDTYQQHPQIESKKKYKAQLKHWQNRLTHVQQTYFHQKRRAIIVLEGWDAAGKGGTIRRITEKLDPRGIHVYPIGKPTEQEQGRHYLYRFQNRLPEPGSWALFDRSYYGRVLVERVEQLATDAEWQRAYREINEFERLLSDDGVRIVKLFFHITAEEQAERFSERLHNPYKRWKLTHEDLRNRARRSDYYLAINDMLANTDTRRCPWHVIAGNHKWYARVDALRTIVAQLSEGVDICPPPIDEKLVSMAESQLISVPSEED